MKYRRALAHFDLKMYEAAINDATEVLQLDATHVNARSLLGKAYKIIHEYQKAEEQLTNAILIESDQAHLYAGKNFWVAKAVLWFLTLGGCMTAERGDIRFRTGQQNKIIEAVYGKFPSLRTSLSQNSRVHAMLMLWLYLSPGRFRRGGKAVGRAARAGQGSRAAASRQ